MKTGIKIWLGVDKNNRVQATWWRGCKQTHARWRKAVKNLGWRPICTTLDW